MLTLMQVRAHDDTLVALFVKQCSSINPALLELGATGLSKGSNDLTRGH